MDRRLIAGALTLLCIQIVLLVTDVDLYPDSADLSSQAAPGAQIGVLIDKKQNVKRRSQGSVVWEDSQKSDLLLGYDSILTLENSSAQLQLENDVRIQLHENTLVVLEPPASLQEDSLRIRFSRGNLLAQNQGRRMQVGSGEWRVEAQPGTDMSLKTLEGDKVEVEVATGTVQVQNTRDATKTETIAMGTRFTLAKDEIQDLQKVSTELKLDLRSEERVYAFDFPIVFLARWRGEADQLRIVQAGERPRFIDVPPGQQSLELSLQPGTYSLSLAQGAAVSSEVTVRALPAPSIRYTAPLPRDRFTSGDEILFSWLPLEGASTYEIALTTDKGDRAQQSAGGTRTKWHVPLEGGVEMRVFGIDELGFRIPPRYAQPIYILRDPLAPPRLQKPGDDSIEPRAPSSQPATDGARAPNAPSHWWQILLPHAAHAEDLPVSDSAAPVAADTVMVEAPSPQQQIVFGWYPVTGADFYTIEISSESDFANPEVMAKVFGEKYQWSAFTKKVYYWRVAAGAKSGRMGLFSETAVLDLTKLDLYASGEIAPGVRLIDSRSAPPVRRKVENLLDAGTDAKPDKKIEVLPAPREDNSNTSLKDLVSASAALAREEKPNSKPAVPAQWRLGFDVDLHYLNFSYKQDFSATLTGVADTAFEMSLDVIQPDADFWRWRWSYARVSWEPESTKAYPFQPKFISDLHSLRGLYFNNSRDLGWGLQVKTLPVLKRVALEELEISETTLVGPIGGYELQISRGLNLESSGGLLFGSGMFTVTSENRLRYTRVIRGWPTYVGGDLNFSLFFGSDSVSGFETRTGLFFGLEW